MVSISYCLEHNSMLDINDFGNINDCNDCNFTFSQNQFQLPGNAAKILTFRNFVLDFVLCYKKLESGTFEILEFKISVS